MKQKAPHMDLLERAAASIKLEDYSAALNDLIWLHKNSGHTPMFRAFRAVPFLEVWRYLASVYPPALEALKDVSSDWERESQTLPPDDDRAAEMRRYAAVIQEIEHEFPAPGT